MREMLTRRVQRVMDGDEKFAPLPNAFMIDGGLGARSCARRCSIRAVGYPCFGMVKMTATVPVPLVAPDGREFIRHLGAVCAHQPYAGGGPRFAIII